MATYPPSLEPERVLSCLACPVGKACGIGQGSFCRWVSRRKRAGEILFLEGEPASTVWFIKSGTVVLSRSGSQASREETASGVRTPGSFVGLEALVRPTYLDLARITEDAVLCGAARDTVDAWLGPPNAPARMILEQTLRALAAVPPRAASPDGSASGRLARWLLETAHRDDAPPIPRRYVASLLGMAPETLSRALAHLSEQGLIELTRKRLRIKDRDGLELLAEA
jgi:CRP/FNR family transcriptional regulator